MFGIVQMGIGVVERAAVVGAENEKAHHFGIVFFQHVADGEKIAQRFGHFFVVHADKAVVQPVFHMAINHFVRGVGRVFAADAVVCAAALGDFVFVVGKLQICATAVDVKCVAKQFAAHGGAFNVPAWSSVAPRALPMRLFGFGGFPQHKIQRVALKAVHFHALAGAQVVQRFAR